MKYFTAICLSLSFFLNTNNGLANDQTKNRQKYYVKLSTMNLMWFGIGGTMWNEPEQEYRHQYLKRFIDQELADSDVIVFTEVVKVDQLEALLKPKMDCASYQGAWSRHQHIAICYKAAEFRTEKYDHDYIIEEVDLGSGGLRPAAQAKLCHRYGSCFLQVIGVHLAAGQKTEKRIRQVEFIRADLDKQSDRLPTVITGDFNSYFSFQSGLSKNDIDYFEEILSDHRIQFHSVNRDIRTYNYGKWARTYDHIVVSSDIGLQSKEGYEACQENQDFRRQFIPYPSFRKYFSDHCPVTAELVIRN